MAEFEEQKFRVVKTKGKIQNDLGEMTGIELEPYVEIRLGNDAKAAGALSELKKKGAVGIPYTESFGVAATLEIERVA